MVIIDMYKLSFVNTDLISNIWKSGTRLYCKDASNQQIFLGNFKSSEAAQLALIDIAEAIVDGVRLYVVEDITDKLVDADRMTDVMSMKKLHAYEKLLVKQTPTR